MYEKSELTIWHYVPEAIILHEHHCENIRLDLRHVVTSLDSLFETQVPC
jgi:hypothetical protein